MKENRTIEFLYNFVDRENPSLYKPFSQELKIGKYICATNGYIVVLIPENKINKIKEINTKAPKIDNILPKFIDNIELDFNIIINAYKNIPIKEYEIEHLCDSCDGDGKFEHYGHFYECKECNEKGIVKTGRFEKDRNRFACFAFKAIEIEIKYIEKLIKVYLYKKEQLKSDPKFKILNIGRVIWFSIDNILVALSPMYKDIEDQEKYETIKILN